MELLEKARTHVEHCELKKVLLKAAAEFVSRREKKSLPAPEVKSPKSLKGQGRYIPVPVRQLVKERDGHQCSYVSPEGKRCSEKCRLEFDHVVPIAVGGESSAENLRLLCRAHNQLEAERAFGREFVAAKRI